MPGRGVRTVNVKQLSVFVENKPGIVSEVADVLGRADVNIRGFSVCDTSESGVVRLVVDDPERGQRALRDADFMVRVSDVLCAELPDHPGGLSAVLKEMSAAGVNVDYVYSMIGTYAVIEVADIDRAMSLLAGKPVHLVTQEEIAQA